MRWLGKGRLRHFRGQKGLTLIEVLVAVAILAAIGVTFIASMNTAHRSVGVLDEKTQAKALAYSQLEQIKDAPYPEAEPYYGNAFYGNGSPEGTEVYPEDVIIDLPPQYSMAINVVVPTCIGESDNCTPLDELIEYDITTIQQITISIFRAGSEGDRPVFSLSCYKSR